MTEPPNSTQGTSGRMYELRPEETPSEAVIAAVAESTGQPILEMKPLAEAIDPDALDALHSTTTENASSVTVMFEYCGCQVAVTPGEVQVDR